MQAVQLSKLAVGTTHPNTFIPDEHRMEQQTWSSGCNTGDIMPTTSSSAPSFSVCLFWLLCLHPLWFLPVTTVRETETWFPVPHTQRSTHLDFSFLRNTGNGDLTLQVSKLSKCLQLNLEFTCILHPSSLFLPLGPSFKCRNVYSNSGLLLWFLDKTPEFSWKSAHSPRPIPSS